MAQAKDNKIGYRWFCNTISNLLGIYDTKYAEDLLEEYSEQIKSFYDDDFTQNADIDKQIIFLWRTYYDKMVEETITVLEEGKGSCLGVCGLPGSILSVFVVPKMQFDFFSLLTVTPPEPVEAPAAKKGKGKAKGKKFKNSNFWKLLKKIVV